MDLVLLESMHSDLQFFGFVFFLFCQNAILVEFPTFLRCKQPSLDYLFPVALQLFPVSFVLSLQNKKFHSESGL